MPRGGVRAGAGRKAKPKAAPASKSESTRVLSKLGSEHRGKQLPSEDDLWLTLLLAQDLRVRLDALRYLTDRRDGKPVQTVNHVHDKPLQLEMKVSLAEAIQKARKRAGI